MKASNTNSKKIYDNNFNKGNVSQGQTNHKKIHNYVYMWLIVFSSGQRNDDLRILRKGKQKNDTDVSEKN